MRLEKDLMKQIINRLDLYQFTGEVEWYLRINAGKLKSYYGSYIRLAPKNTPDYIVILRNRQDNITVLFIEAKSDTGKLQQGQKEFAQKYNKRDIFTITVRDIKELDYFIENHAKNFIKDLCI